MDAIVTFNNHIIDIGGGNVTVVADKLPPIQANTLRFKFSDETYDPTVAGVGSSGTWTKIVGYKYGNIWDWTNTNTSWATAFGGGGTGIPGAFDDYEHNRVSVIDCGDCSSVTDYSRFFQNCYGIDKILKLDTSGATNVFIAFSNCENCSLFPSLDFRNAMDTRGVFQSCFKMIEAPWIDFPTDHSFSLANFFTGCHRLKTIPLYDLSQCTSLQGFLQWNSTTHTRMEIEVIPNFDTRNVTSMQNAFNGTSVKEFPEFNVSNVTIASNLFAHTYIEHAPNLSFTKKCNFVKSFDQCFYLQEIPNWNWTLATRIDDAFNGCLLLTKIPDMGVPTNCTRCDNMFKNCVNIKSGITQAYDNLSQVTGITNHTDCFLNCGSNTIEGQAELAQIPTSWGGTLSEE